MSELTTFASRLTLPNGVMVAHQILVLFVWVRVLFGQPKFQTSGLEFFLYSPLSSGISPSTTAATAAAARSLARCRPVRRIGFRAALAAGNPAPQSCL